MCNNSVYLKTMVLLIGYWEDKVPHLRSLAAQKSEVKLNPNNGVDRCLLFTTAVGIYVCMECFLLITIVTIAIVHVVTIIVAITINVVISGIVGDAVGLGEGNRPLTTKA